MILIDTSAWVEFLRGTDSAVCNEVDRLLGSRIAVADPIVMEVLAGARGDSHLRNLRGVMGRATRLRCEPLDYDNAALLYRACRQRGEPVRKLVDCLIASVAIRVGTPLLHADADFDALARHTELALHAV